MNIMGLDPGLNHTGWGIVELNRDECQYVACGHVSTDNRAELAVRLCNIFREIQTIIASHNIAHIAIEDTYVNVNSKSSLHLAHARAAAILAAATLQIVAVNYHAKTIKKSLTGNGNAPKEQVAKMLQLRLQGFETMKDKDAIDALAVAFCHAHHL